MPRTIERTRQFKKDLRRELQGARRKSIAAELEAVVEKLANDEPLEPRHRDHPLTNRSERDCHLLPDVLLLYEKPDDETLLLIRIGSHAELFG